MKHTIEVENIKCGGCVNSIKSSLSKMEGVEYVAVDKDTEIIDIEGSIERTALVEKLHSLGYPEKGHNSLMTKAKSYISCAVGRMSEPTDN